MKIRNEDIYRKAESYIDENRMLPPGTFVAAGISGGSDSVVMLHMLMRYAESHDIYPAVVHVNHGIRGDEARRDAEFVRDICARHNWEYRLYEYDVPQMSRDRHISLEEAGREARRDAFERFRKEKNVDAGMFRVALAHNMNDLCETFLHNLARGTGIRGLCSMRAFSGNIIRPVLCLSKEEILAYASEEGLSWIHDSTNESDDYTRNRIRRYVIPEIVNGVNPKALEHIAETALMAEAAVDYLDKKAAEVLQECLSKDMTTAGETNAVMLGSPFYHADPALHPYIIMKAFELLAGRRRDFGRNHVESVLDLASGNDGRGADLPESIRAVKESGGIRLSRTFDEDRSEKKVIEKQIFPYKGEKIRQNLCTKWFDYDKITGSVEFRTRKTGDYMVIHPDGRKKKLTRIMMDDGIPARLRESIPLAVSGSHVLWIAGGRSTEAFRVDDSTKTILELNLTGGENYE